MPYKFKFQLVLLNNNMFIVTSIESKIFKASEIF